MKVYLSSTLIDLKPERLAVKEALGNECIVVESYAADERSVRDSCLDDVAGCDLYIGIVGMRYGALATGSVCSITELEFREARARGIPIWIFVKDVAHVLAEFHDAVSSKDGRERIEAFRSTLTGVEAATRPAMFTTPADLTVQVLKSLGRLRRTKGEPKLKPITGDPYPGLRAFRTEEADRFFGRDEEVAELRDRLLVNDQRFVALIGASGSGKSSIVYAGLIPKLTANPAGVPWKVVTLMPRKMRDDPFLSLAAAFDRQFPDLAWSLDDLEQRLREHPADIAAVATQALSNVGPDARLLLFVDQFEEIFAHKVDSAVRTAFFALLAAAVACPLLRVVISMRADFYAQWPQDEASTKLLRDGHFPVAAPGPVALAKMIEEPAAAAGLRFDPPGLVQRILDETGTAPGSLALLELALSQLHAERAGDTLTETAYTTIGGVAGVIERQAERAATQAGQAITRAGEVLDDEAWSRLFVAIASVEEREHGLAVVRRRAAAVDLRGAALTLAQHLVDKRLLVSSSGSGNQPAQYEVGHEAVFSHWQRFRDWYAMYAADLATRRQVERAAAEWHQGGRPEVLRWGWERQKPALAALHKLNHLAPPLPGAHYTDVGIALWRSLEALLGDTPITGFLYPEPLALLDELSLDATWHLRREAIGLRLNQIGDPRRGVGLRADGLPDLVWIDVPAGEVTIDARLEPDAVEPPKRLVRIDVPGGAAVCFELEPGTDELSKGRRQPEAAPHTRFAVNSFQLARYPVTWCQYGAFLGAEDGYANPVWWESLSQYDSPGHIIWSAHNYPAVNVCWYDAMAYCRWLSAKLGCEIRLPTECEWQWAAVADTGRQYPWPGDWDAGKANSEEAGVGRTVAVGLYPRGRSLFGFDDMSGNVSEWCLDEMPNLDKVAPTDLEPFPEIRGGSWRSTDWFLRSLLRGSTPAAHRDKDLGFRVCRVSPIEKTVAGRTGE